MVEMAGVYGDALTLTCILDEGDMTRTSGSLVETGKMGTDVYTFGGTVLESGDFVCLSKNAVHTYANCGGLPVVKAADATDGWIGILKTTPVWNKIPGSTGTTTWNATSLAAGTFRVASVVFPGLNKALKAQSNGDGTTGTPAIEVGAPLQWDVSEKAFADNGDFRDNEAGGTFAFHHCAADNTNILVGFGMWGGAGGNNDMAAFDVTA